MGLEEIFINYLFVCCTEDYTCTGNGKHWHIRTIKALEQSRWPEPIYMRVGYVFESRFSTGTISPISMIFSILNKE